MDTSRLVAFGIGADYSCRNAAVFTYAFANVIAGSVSQRGPLPYRTANVRRRRWCAIDFSWSGRS
jgi:hypothetical protein